MTVPKQAVEAALREWRKVDDVTQEGWANAKMRRILAAALPLMGVNTTDLEAVADAIDAARYAHPDHPRERPRPFAEADRGDREYAFRLARAAVAALPAQSGSGVREDVAELLKFDPSPANQAAVVHTAFRHVGHSKEAATAHTAIEKMDQAEWLAIVDYATHWLQKNVRACHAILALPKPAGQQVEGRVVVIEECATVADGFANDPDVGRAQRVEAKYIAAAIRHLALSPAPASPQPREDTLALATRPVAFRVKDYGDEWILFHDEAAANRYHEETGALMQGLYVRDGSPLVAEKRGE